MGNVMPLTSARALSASWRQDLTTSLKINIQFELHHPERAPWPPGAVDYTASFTVGWDRERAESASPGEAQILAGLTRDLTEDEDGYVTVQVGTAELIVADLYSPCLFESLDARSADLAHIGGVLLNIGEGELADDLLEQVDGIGQGLIIVQDVSILQPWRGLNLGLIATGLSLQHLTNGNSALAALHPMDPDLTEPGARAAAHEALGAHWSKLGFRPFRDEIYVLDLALIDLGESMKKLTSTP